MEPRLSNDGEALLQHAGWLRALAASLTADPSAADDVVQDAWLAALRKPPSDEQPLAPWLASVVRNLAWKRRRGEARRSARELAAHTQRESARPDETLARLETARKLVEAVASVEEPFRTTLVLRYFEERSSAEIARGLGVPAGTVRWRLKRGLELLRERLDARFGGSRESWVLVLAPIAARDGALATGGTVAASKTVLATEGVLAMGALKIASGLIVATLVVAGLWWSRASEPASPAREVVAATPTEQPAAPASSPVQEPLAPSADVERVPIAQTLAQETPEPRAPIASTPSRLATIDVRFVDAAGAPWSQVDVISLESGATPLAVSGADGRARFDVDVPVLWTRDRDGTKDVRNAAGIELVARRAGCTPVALRPTVQVGGVAHLGDIVLTAGVRLTGSVVDDQGRALAGATIGIAPAELPPDDEGRMHRHGSKAFDAAVATKSTQDGSFVLDGVAPGSWRLWGKAEGMRYAWSEPFTVESARDVFALELTLTPFLPTDRIAGRVIDPAGNPIHASIFFMARDGEWGYGRSLNVDDAGRFDLLIERDARYHFQATSPRFAPAELDAVLPGTLDVVLQLGELRYIDVHLVDGAGAAIDEGTFDVTVLRGALQSTAEQNRGNDGHYRVSVPAQAFQLTASAPRFRAESRGPFEAGAIPSQLEIVMRPAPVVRGRITADGKPAAGVRVELLEAWSDGGGTVNDFRCVISSFPKDRATTNAEGEFALAADVDGEFWIRAELDGWAPGEIGPLDPSRLDPDETAEFALTHGGAIEGRVLLADGKDAEGTIVAISHGDGHPRTMRAGPKGVFRFDGLTAGKWQVLPRDTEIDPGTTNFGIANDSAPIEWSCEVVGEKTTRFDLDLTKR